MKNDAIKLQYFEKLTSALPQILIYNGIVAFTAMMIGIILLYTVRKFKLDIHYKIFRFQNNWHYLLTSEILDIRNVKSAKAPNNCLLEAVYIDALVESDSKMFLYKGMLSDYLLSKDGGLNLLYLSQTIRSSVNDPEKNEVAIPGDFFILKYSNIMNLNVTYHFKERKKISWKEVFEVALGLAILILPIIGIIYLGKNGYPFIAGISSALYILFIRFLMKKEG